MQTKWITFDLDETVMQNPFGKWVFPELVAMLKREAVTEEDIMHLIISEHLQRMRDEQFLEAYDWDDILVGIAKKLEIETDINVESMVIKHSKPSKVYLLEENMLFNLEKIKRKGFRLAAVTNGYAKYQLPVLKQLGLDTVFEEVITSDSEGFAKPHTSILGKLLVKGEVIAHVGDRIDHDVQLANELGILSVFIHRSLPEAVLKVPVDERAAHPSFIRLCEEKWYKENRLRETPFLKNKCIPDLVVQSIEELAKEIDVFLE